MRREDRRVVGILGFLHGAVHANILAIPVFLNLAWGAAFGADTLTLGVLAAIGFSLYGLGAVPFGYLADHGAPGRLLGVCALGIAVAMAAIALSPSIVLLAASLAALGFFSAVYHPTGLSVISRAVAAQGRAMGWHGMGGSLGIAAGPLFVSATLALGWSWRIVAALMVVPAVVAALLLFVGRLPDSGAADPEAPRVNLRTLFTPPFVLIIVVYMFAGFAYQGSLTFLPRFIGSGLFVLALAVGAVGQVVSGRRADRPNPEGSLFRLSLLGAGLLGLLSLIVFVGYPAVIGVAAFGATALVFGLVLFSLEPLQNTLVTGEAPRSLRGFAFGFTFLSVFGVGSIGAVLAGLLIQQNQVAPLFLILGVCMAASGTAALRVRRNGGLRSSA
ncbi:MAG TPA: MFS transporter [Thermoplasmata archaeon]|nr:MFS transporter [Thermoplasmata archaeon]